MSKPLSSMCGISLGSRGLRETEPRPLPRGHRLTVAQTLDFGVLSGSLDRRQKIWLCYQRSSVAGSDAKLR